MGAIHKRRLNGFLDVKRGLTGVSSTKVTSRFSSFGFTGARVSSFGPLSLAALSLPLGLNARDMLIS